MGGWLRLLIAHRWDGTALGPQRVVSVELDVDAAGALLIQVEAPFYDDPHPGGFVGSLEGLWEHEVVEVFVAHASGAPYLEVELGPHGHHLVLTFSGVRECVRRGLPIEYAASHDGSLWRGRAVVPASYLPPAPHRVNAFALHGAGAGREYLLWSLLPGDQPDFHQPARFPEVDLSRGR